MVLDYYLQLSHYIYMLLENFTMTIYINSTTLKLEKNPEKHEIFLMYIEHFVETFSEKKVKTLINILTSTPLVFLIWIKVQQ